MQIYITQLKFFLVMLTLFSCISGMERSPMVVQELSEEARLSHSEYCKGIFKGKLVTFRIQDVPGDGSCAYHVFKFIRPELTRQIAAEQLLAHKNDSQITSMLFPELKAAFKEGTLPKEMLEDSLYKNIRQQFFEAEQRLDAKVRALHDKHNIKQSKEAKELYNYLDSIGHLDDAAELKKLIDELDRKEKLIDSYCQDLTTFVNFVTHKESKKCCIFLTVLFISVPSWYVKSSPTKLETIKAEVIVGVAALVLYKAHQAYLKDQANNKYMQQENKPLIQKLNNSLVLNNSMLIVSVATYGICIAITGRFAS